MEREETLTAHQEGKGEIKGVKGKGGKRKRCETMGKNKRRKMLKY